MRIGIDIGGMSIKAAVVEENKAVLRSSTKTVQDDDKAFVNAIISCIDEVVKGSNSNEEIESIGIGLPGVVDRENGLLISCNNIRHGIINIREALQSRYGNISVDVENDANCAALGEFYASDCSNNFVFITLGTGIGGGVIIGGKLLLGCNGTAAEFGHIVTHSGGRQCTCGRHGCYEMYASMTALTNDAQEQSYTLNMDKRLIDGKSVFDKEETESKYAKRIIDRWLREVAVGATSIVNIFQPEELVLGGAVTNRGDRILKPIAEYVREHEFTSQLENIPKTRICLSRLGDSAGLVGAALLYKNR